MLKVTLLVLLAIILGFVDGGVSDLPSYISKCSLSDPNLSKCLVEKANEAIPIIIKGDLALHITPLSPVAYAEAPLNGIGLKYIMYDTYTDDWTKFRFTTAQLDMKNGRGSFTAVVDRVEIVGPNYEITEGKMLDIQVHGHGKCNLTFVGFKVHYNGNVRLYKKGDDEYLDYFDSKADTSCERAYFHFENLQSTQMDDMNGYIDKEWERFFAQMKPAFDSYLNTFLVVPFKAITTAVPFNKIFLP